MTQNLVARHLSNEEWAAVDQAITALFNTLEPALVAIAADRRKRVVKMGDGSEAFCRQALDVMAENAGLMPRDFAIDEMRRDLEAHDALNTRLVKLSKLMEKAHDTETALGSDVMMAALEGYSYLKTAGKGEGVEALRKLLGKRFDNSGRKVETAPVPATA